MIDLNFGLWWSGSKLSYLRYLTFKTLRHFHPHSRIQLFTCNKFKKDVDMGVSQEFTNNSVSIDYLDKLEKIDVEVVRVNYFSKYAPNHQSDIFRWWFLKDFGGFYLDTDQIILKSFKLLPLKEHDFVYSVYDIDSSFALGGKFYPVGVIGANKKSVAIKHIASVLMQYYDASNYNSLGPLMFADVLKKLDLSKAFNAPQYYFYPAAICDRMEGIYNGSFELSKESFSAHWYGGYHPSQKFNRKYTEEFAQKSDDTISKFLREKKII